MAPADMAAPKLVTPPEISVHLDTVKMAVDADTGVDTAADADANYIMGAASECCVGDNADINIVASSNMDSVAHATPNQVAAVDQNSIAALNSNADANAGMEGNRKTTPLALPARLSQFLHTVAT